MLAAHATAQDRNTEASADEPVIVITANYRNSPWFEAAGSQTLLDESFILDASEQHFEELTHWVPNLNWAGGSSRPRYFQIRGIGERSQYQGAPNPSVGFLVDDIDFSGMGGIATLFDTTRVEVLRGPQGTRYGANALGGLIYIQSAEPTFDFSARAKLMLADDETWGAGIAVGDGLTDDLAFRASIYQYAADGFRYNAFLQRHDTNERDERSARLKLRWMPGESWQVDLTLMQVRLDNGYDAWAIDNSFTTQSDKPGRDEQDSTAGALKAIWTGHRAFTFTSITTHAESDVLFSFDGDWGNPVLWGVNGPYDFTSENHRRRKTTSQEFRWVSTPVGALAQGRIDWLAGLYGLNLKEGNRNLDMFNGGIYTQLQSDYEANHVAAFTQFDWHWSTADRLSLGLRVERRTADYFDSNGQNLTPSETMTGGHLTWTHDMDRRRTAYVTLARGYKAGGFNIGAQIPVERREYGAEHLWNLEGGLKGYWLDGRLRAQASLFYMERRDQQVKTSFQDDPNDPLSFTFFTDNAARGQNYGAELESRFRVNDAWSVEANLGLLRTNLEDYVFGTRILNGRQQAHAPKYTWAAAVNYQGPQGWFGRLEATGKDSFYFSDSHDQMSKAYALVNARLGYAGDAWRIYLWGRNIFDRRYAVRGFFFANEPPDWIDKLYTRQGDPAQWGITWQADI